MRIVGISALYHDSAAAMVDDGRIVAAAQEERFTRKRHDARFPKSAIAYCLGEAGCRLSDIDQVVFYDKPFLKFERLIETYLAFAPRGFTSFRLALPVWLKEKLFLKELLTRELRAIDGEFSSQRLLFTEIICLMLHQHSSRPRSNRRRCSPWTASANGRQPRSVSARAMS